MHKLLVKNKSHWKRQIKKNNQAIIITIVMIITEATEINVHEDGIQLQ